MWYIFRYTGNARLVNEKLAQCEAEFFFPFKKVRKDTGDSRKIVYTECPIISNYFFVRSSIEKALSISSSTGLYLWRHQLPEVEDCSVPVTNSEEERIKHLSSAYYSVSDEEIEVLRRVAEVEQRDMVLLNAADVDLEHDDYVEITSGALAGMRGHLRTSSGKAGGFLAIELEGVQKLYYGFHVRQEEIRVINFAAKSRSSIDNIKNARNRMLQVLEKYRFGEQITDKEVLRLKGAASRYSQASGLSPRQTANLQILLLGTYLILDMPILLEETRRNIEEKVIPAMDKRIATARGKHKTAAKVAKEKFEAHCRYISESQEMHSASILPDRDPVLSETDIVTSL